MIIEKTATEWNEINKLSCGKQLERIKLYHWQITSILLTKPYQLTTEIDLLFKTRQLFDSNINWQKYIIVRTHKCSHVINEFLVAEKGFWKRS